MAEGIRPYRQRVNHVLRARSPEEREKRRAHLFALLLVSAVAIVKYVSGWTVHDERFTLYLLAIAGSAALGGFLPGLVATLTAIVFTGLGTAAPGGLAPRALFVAEGLSVALIVSAVRSGSRTRAAGLAAAQRTIAELRVRDRRRRLLDAVLRHLEDTAGETAVVVLDNAGTIDEWRTGAERLYGYSAEEVVGASATMLFFHDMSAAELSALLDQAVETGVLRRSDVHRRKDGARVDVEIELRRLDDVDGRAFTLTMHDMATRHEWDEYREAARCAQVALQQAADDARQELAALENLTDPELNPFGGPAMITELLERLRTTVGADGAALVRPGRTEAGVVTARGLQPLAQRVPAQNVALTPGRVTVVHNDRARVEQMSALRWSAGVASLLVVPVVHNGRVWSTIEVVHERPRHVTDWDVALARVVADRLAAVVVQSRGLAAKAS